MPIKPSLITLTLAFLLGDCLVQMASALAPYAWGAGFGTVLTLACVLHWRAPRATTLVNSLWLLAALAAGASWATLRGLDYLEHRLPEELAGRDVWVSGRISSIPLAGEHSQRFEFRLDSFDEQRELGELGALATVPQRLRISWYYGPPVLAGEHWRLRLRLKPPHGFFNPGGFDYEAWLYQQDIHATGYVREHSGNVRLAAAGVSLVALREHIAQRMARVLADHPQAGIIATLAVGEHGVIDAQQWQQLLRTGTNHLMSISGLHIGLAAAFGYVIVRRILCRCMPARWFLRLPAQHMAMIAGVMLALGYALLAGMSIPTQRSLIMLLCMALALWLRRNMWGFDTLALALLVVLWLTPTSVLAPGAWFSFVAVAAMFYAFRGDGARWQRWLGVQVVITLALAPLSLFMFQQTSLVSPLANLIFVPYVSLLVVPLILLAMLSLPVSTFVSDSLLQLAASLMQLAWPLLEWMAAQPYAFAVQAKPALWSVMLATLGVAVALAPPRWRVAHWQRGIGLGLLLPLLWLRPETPMAGDFELHQLDVGQGLAVVVRTAGHTLVFDSGARMSENLDAGQSVVVPFLRQLGVSTLDRLVISHGDADHIGGATSILAEYPDAELWGRDIEALSASLQQACGAGQRWRWDGVDFEFLHPPADFMDKAGKRNHHSCVLRVSNAAAAVLITGDIERDVEQALLATQPDRLKAEVLVVPHHGSKTSSSEAFIEAVAPRYALISAGYRNRYRLPAAAVVARYLERDVTVLISAEEGALSLNMSAQTGVQLIDRHRREHAHYWNHAYARGDK